MIFKLEDELGNIYTMPSESETCILGTQYKKDLIEVTVQKEVFDDLGQLTHYEYETIIVLLNGRRIKRDPHFKDSFKFGRFI